MIVRLTHTGSTTIMNATNGKSIMTCSTPSLAERLVNLINETEEFFRDYERSEERSYHVDISPFDAIGAGGVLSAFEFLEKEV